MCTQKQIRCIYAVSKQLGEEVDEKQLREISIDEASEIIDSLKTKLVNIQSNLKVVGIRKDYEFNPQRFGMCVKLVVDKYSEIPKGKDKPDFGNAVAEFYNDVTEIEESLRAAPQEA